MGGAQHAAPLQPGSARVSEGTRAAGQQKILDALLGSPAAAAMGPGHALLQAAAQVSVCRAVVLLVGSYTL